MCIEQAELIETPEQLEAFRERYGVREDWHEPDEQEVSASVVGERLDNARGAYTNGIGHYEELVVVLKVDGKDAAQINLANLLAWGCTGKAQF